MDQPIVQLYNIKKSYGQNLTVLEDINLKVEKGEFVFLSGQSGAGKTTLLKLIFCTEKANNGQLLVNGKNLIKIKKKEIPEFRRKIGVVFQDFKLIHNKTVFENVSYPLFITGSPRQYITKKTWNTLKLVGLSNKKDEYPINLSGGEQQRVAIARALVNEPILLLADEPTGNLDHVLAKEIIYLFKCINQKGTTIILATHNIDIIQLVQGTRLVKINKGRIV